MKKRVHIKFRDFTFCGLSVRRNGIAWCFDLDGQSYWPDPCRKCRSIAKAKGQRARRR